MIPVPMDQNISPLSPPGQDSNYLDWAFVAETHFRSMNRDHVLKKINPKDRDELWEHDNTAVCATLSQI
ncbi:uncharacterized protein MELLADRAFT_117102, partial [Melampsora larici-populina 98AG31]